MRTTNLWGYFGKKFNEAYRVVNGPDTKFMPVGWCTDMMSSNFTGISVVYGDTVIGKIKGCGFHYHQNVQRQIRSLDESHQSIFNTLVNDMAKATTPEAYTKAYNDLYSFILSNNETKDRVSWLSWWHDRRNIMFKAFTSGWSFQ